MSAENDTPPASLQIWNEALAGADYSQSDVEDAVHGYVGLLGVHHHYVTPSQIASASDLIQFVFTGRTLKKLQSVAGTERIHIPKSAEGLPLFHSWVRLAALLSAAGRVTEIEPASTGDKATDFLWQTDSEAAHVELKTLTTDLSQYLPMHKVVARTLDTIMRPDVQLSVRFRRQQPLTFWEEVARSLESLVPHVSGEGTLIRNVDLEVVAVPMQPNHPQATGGFFGMEKAIDTGEVFPMSLFASGRGSIAIAGPQVDVTKRIKRLLDRARAQAPKDEPYVLAIDVRDVLGSRLEIKKFLEKEFQPEQNRRVSGALLFDVWPDNGSEVDFVQNPYAAHPISRPAAFALRNVKI